MQLSALADDLREVAGTLGAPVRTLVGASWGGAVALLGAEAGIARSLVLVDPLISVEPGGFGTYVDDLAPLVAAPAGPERDAAVSRGFADADPVDRAGKVHALHALDLECIRRLGTDNAVDEGGWNLREILASLTIPTTLLIAGEESVVSSRDLERLGPGVIAQTVVDHGHTLHRSAFELFVQAVSQAA